ncbi:hypothetical protein [Paraburkholderia sp. BR10882]|uniref:hypothetical protein n=1 Tax=unclassified Paraburkholderia TaxID=2615204 RepID=UPI0034CFFA4A
MTSRALDKALNAGYAQADRLAKPDRPVGEDWLPLRRPSPAEAISAQTIASASVQPKKMEKAWT